MGLDDVRSVGITEGLVEQKVSAGTLIRFATQPEHVAYDGIGENGYFTEALLEQLKQNVVEVELLLKDVRAQVLKATENKSRGPQIPWVHSALIGEFRFGLRKKEATKVKPDGSGKSKREHDNRFTLAAAEWDRIRDTSDIDRLVRFEKHFAGTYYAEEAASRRLELEADAQRRREAHHAERRQEAEKRRVGRTAALESQTRSDRSIPGRAGGA